MVGWPEDDPYSTSKIQELTSAREYLAQENGDVSAIDRSMNDIRERLITSFSERENELFEHGTNAEEMAERFMLVARTEGQLEAWSSQAYDREFEASEIIGDDLTRLRGEYEAVGYDEERIEQELENHVERVRDYADVSIKPEYQKSYTDLLNELSTRADNIIDDYELPRDIEETIAKDQLMQADRYYRLADVPAIKRIANRLEDSLSESDLERVREGDATALLEEVKDPAIRAAVASELRNEPDFTPVEGDGDQAVTGLRHSEPVEQFQQMVRLARSNSIESKDAVPDLGDDFGI